MGNGQPDVATSRLVGTPGRSPVGPAISATRVAYLAARKLTEVPQVGRLSGSTSSCASATYVPAIAAASKGQLGLAVRVVKGAEEAS